MSLQQHVEYGPPSFFRFVRAVDYQSPVPHPTNTLTAYFVAWLDGTETKEPSSWALTVEGGNGLSNILTHADNPWDDEETKTNKAEVRNSLTVQSGPRAFSSSQLPESACSVCKRWAFGWFCQGGCRAFVCVNCPCASSTWLCPTHGGDQIVMSEEITALPVPVQGDLLYCCESYPSADVGHWSDTAPPSGTKHVTSTMPTMAQVLFLQYHSNANMTTAEHSKVMQSVVDRYPHLQYVVVFSCWTNPAAQQLALRELRGHLPTAGELST